MAIGYYIKSLMIIYTDDINFAEQYITIKPEKWAQLKSSTGTEISPLLDGIFADSSVFEASHESSLIWRYATFVKSSPQSQYDIVNDLCQKNITLPGSLLCIAGEGANFHGFKNRHWLAPSGNLYLTAYFTPNRAIEHFGAGFMILAAVSVIDAIDTVPELKHKAGIKWVNDIFIDSAKVGGVLAFTHQECDIITGATLGIGLNVTAAPDIAPTPYVPKAGALADFCTDTKACGIEFIFEKLIEALDQNYNLLINGGYRTLLNEYRERSLAIGRRVEVRDDKDLEDGGILGKGVVIGIGDNLELFLEGRAKPVTRGRLILID